MVLLQTHFTKPVGRSLLAIAAVTLTLGAACSTGGWTADEKSKLADALCEQEFDVAVGSQDCRCVVDAAVDSHDSQREWVRAENPSTQYLNALRRCGFALVPS